MRKSIPKVVNDPQELSRWEKAKIEALMSFFREENNIYSNIQITQTSQKKKLFSCLGPFCILGGMNA